jgi:hypothetical protein
MIVVKLSGGLGNQLFQYAAGRRLAEIHDSPLYLDLQWFDENTNRSYKLDHFKIHASVIDQKRLKILLDSSTKYRFYRWLEKIPSLIQFREPYFHYDPSFEQLPDNIYLEGYWQSEHYFKNIADSIQHELTITTPLQGKNLDLANRIINSNAVSVHIRRGDYAQNLETAVVHGACSLEYYQLAIDRLSDLVSPLHFFIFSDEPDWVLEHFHLLGQKTIVDNNDANHDYEDLRLMSLCKHHIIANSSFSWWAAWLCNYFGKIVFMPQRWFRDTSHKVKDIYVDGWFLIEAGED